MVYPKKMKKIEAGFGGGNISKKSALIR